MSIDLLNRQDIKRRLDELGFLLFEDDSKPFNINLIGIRSEDATPNVFNDRFIAMWKYDGFWTEMNLKCTTEAGLYYLNNPLNNKGTAILKGDQQNRGMWANGKHQGRYDALVQVKPATVIRDFDRDSEFDYDSGREETGIFGINGHRSNESVESLFVNKWSAGCQVMANPDEFKMLIKATLYGAQHWGNSFTYTLLNEQGFR